MTSPRVIAALRRRLDEQALDQLRTIAARQSEQIDALRAENASLQVQLDQAETWCDAWRDDAMRFQMALCERDDGQPAMRMDGSLAVIPAEQVRA